MSLKVASFRIHTDLPFCIIDVTFHIIGQGIAAISLPMHCFISAMFRCLTNFSMKDENSSAIIYGQTNLPFPKQLIVYELSAEDYVAHSHEQLQCFLAFELSTACRCA